MIVSIFFAFFIFTPFQSLAKAPSKKDNISSYNLLLKQKNTKTTLSFEIKVLEKFTQENNSLKIHNKALDFLKNKQKAKALLLLKKNAYQNIFLPSYFTLFQLKIPLFLAPLLWHIGLIFLFLICLVLFYLSFKRSSFFRLKSLFLCISLGFIISISLFFFKKRVSSLEELDLRSSPFIKAPVQTSLIPSSDLIVLKQSDSWFRVKSKDKQTGWLQKQSVFQIF